MPNVHFKPCIQKNLIPLLLYNLCFLYTVRIITCWVSTNSFPTNKNEVQLRPLVSSVCNITGSSQSAITNLVFLVPIAQRKIHVHTHSPVKSKYTSLVLFRGKDISSSVCLLELSLFFLHFSLSSRWEEKGRETSKRWHHCRDLFRVCKYGLMQYIVYVFTGTVHNMYNPDTHTHTRWSTQTHVTMQNFHALSSYLCPYTT